MFCVQGYKVRKKKLHMNVDCDYFIFSLPQQGYVLQCFIHDFLIGRQLQNKTASRIRHTVPGNIIFLPFSHFFFIHRTNDWTFQKT